MSVKQKKICFVMETHYDYAIGGAELQVKYILDYLAGLGRFDLYYICRTNRVDLDENYKIYRVNGINTKIPLFRDFFRVQTALNKIKPDIVYQRVGNAYTGMAAYYCRLNSAKMIWHISHEKELLPVKHILKLTTYRGIIDKRLLEYGIRNTYAIIGQTRKQDELLQNRYNRSCNLIVSNFHPIPEGKITKKDSPLRIIWIANLKPIKRPEIFLDLVRRIPNKTVEFIMVGRNGSTTWHHNLMEKINATPNLTYLGEQPFSEVNKLLESVHLFISTSRMEGFPNTFIQAWMRKLPVISLEVDPDNIIKNYGIGYLAGSVDELTEHTIRLMNKREERETMGEKAQITALQLFPMSNIERIVKLIDAT